MGGIDGPFIGTEALKVGLISRRELAKGFRAVYRNVYVPKDYKLTAAARATAAWLWAGREATVAGLSAAALHGSKWIDAGEPAELIRRCDNVDGIVVHRDKLLADERSLVRGRAGRRLAWLRRDQT